MSFSLGRTDDKERGERLGVLASCVVLVPARSLMRSEEERKRREEREREKADLKYRSPLLQSASRDPARDVPLWRSSQTAPPQGSASTCTSCGSAPAASPLHPHTRNLRRSGTTPRSRTSGFPLSRPSLRLHSKLRHTSVRLDSWLRCFRFDVADTEPSGV